MLNKSKWKGGTLQIETAKESFLHRYRRVHLPVKVFGLFNVIMKTTVGREEVDIYDYTINQ